MTRPVLLYYGTRSRLAPGSVLRPDGAGADSHALSAPGCVCLTPDPATALARAEKDRGNGRPRVYETSPIGRPRPMTRNDRFGPEWQAPAAVVTAEVAVSSAEAASRATGDAGPSPQTFPDVAYHEMTPDQFASLPGTWWHGTTGHGWSSFGGWVHLGTRKAAEDRTDPALRCDDDADLLSVRRLCAARLAAGTTVGPLRDDEDFDAADASGSEFGAEPYVNEFEDKGALSLFAAPDAVVTHEKAVRAALRAGEHVPGTALDPYPWLTTEGVYALERPGRSYTAVSCWRDGEWICDAAVRTDGPAPAYLWADVHHETGPGRRDRTVDRYHDAFAALRDHYGTLPDAGRRALSPAEKEALGRVAGFGAPAPVRGGAPGLT